MNEHWQRLTQLFDAAVELPERDLPAFLDAQCADNTELRIEVERLIQAHRRLGPFMDEPAIASTVALPDVPEPVRVGDHIGSWRLVREIGRGGMGTVQLAERADGAYAQRVALKLIKRGMDTDQVLRRFRVERQILASLDHPNIARLLDGGSTDDGRPFFVMEYIEGQPIHRYAREQRLSVADVLRLFLDVCAAVAAAHRQRVVHRDIKPANILVTAEGVPKLLDFGIASMLEQHSGEPTTVLTGVRMLTPNYASPEQIDGHRVTPASDVYSLGVVLYELLTGRSPLRPKSSSLADGADAVRTGEPEPPSNAVSRPPSQDHEATRPADSPSRLRRRLRGDLDTIVLTALQIEPARRYASADALADDIRRQLGGLPVRARRDTVAYRARKFVERNRAAVFGAAAAGFAGLAGAFAVFALARDPSNTLVAAGLLEPRDRVMVADFADNAGDATLAAAVTEAFRVDLTESPLVHVLSIRQIRAALDRMERSSDLALDDSLAREVAAREGVKAVVTGRVSRVAGRYTISAQIIAANSGDLLTAMRETAADSNDVIAAVDRLSERLRRRIGEPLRSIRSTPPLDQVTTASLPALRAYTEGVRVINSGNRARGIQLLEQAIALDTGFASAHRVLGVTYGDIVERGRATFYMERALEHQARLPFYERWHAVASHAFNVNNDLDGAIEAYHRILERYPDDVRALNNLALVHGLRREFVEQARLMTRAVAVDSSIASIQTGLVIAAFHAGDFDRARLVLDQVWQRFPGSFNAQLAEIYFASARHDWETAERHAETRLAMYRADSLDAMDGLETLAGIVMTRGRLGQAERHSRRVLDLSSRLNSPGRYFSSSLRIAYIELRGRKNTPAAIAAVEDALARYPLDSIQSGDRPYDDLIRFFAAAGLPARGRALLTEAAAADSVSSAPTASRRWARGTLLLAEKRTRDALEELRFAAEQLPCTICALPDLARAYEATGMPDSAQAVLVRYLETPWQWRFETDATELGPAMKRLSQLYESRAKPDSAAAVYTRLLRMWDAADRELHRVLEDVAARTRNP